MSVRKRVKRERRERLKRLFGERERKMSPAELDAWAAATAKQLFADGCAVDQETRSASSSGDAEDAAEPQ